MILTVELLFAGQSFPNPRCPWF